MTNVSDEIVKNLVYLRRYARALTGTQQSGDAYVRFCLEVLLQERDRVSESGDIRRQLFTLFHDVWRSLDHADGRDGAGEPVALKNLTVEARLEALPATERQVLLLTSLEGFSCADAAQIMGIPEDDAERLLVQAWTAVRDQIATSVLVIEDEPIIALDIVGLVRELGHTVVGTAATHADAVALARAKKPGLVLADINLGHGGSGLEAVNQILKSMDVPVIFVTAFPERLLTGDRPEPTYLVTKPFEPDTLRVAISQALSSRAPTEVRRRIG